MIKAVIFDLDGTLVDTEHLHYRAWQQVLRKHKIKLSARVFKKRLAGIGTSKTAEYIVKNYRLSEQAKSLGQEKRDFYFENLIDQVRPRKGAVKAVRSLHKKFRLAIGTSNIRKEAGFLVKNLGFGKYVKIIETGDHHRLKPKPDIYLAVAKKLGVKPVECIVVEDTAVGVIAAKRAGMYCIAAPNGYTHTQDFSRADIKVSGLDKIDLKKIRKLEKIYNGDHN